MYTVIYPAGVAGSAPAPPAAGADVVVVRATVPEPQYILFADAVVIARPSTMHASWLTTLRYPTTEQLESADAVVVLDAPTTEFPAPVVNTVGKLPDPMTVFVDAVVMTSQQVPAPMHTLFVPVLVTSTPRAHAGPINMLALPEKFVPALTPIHVCEVAAAVAPPALAPINVLLL